MRLKILRKWVPSALIAVALMSSITVERLDEVRARADKGKFDAAAYARDFWDKDLLPNLEDSVEFDYLTELLEKNPESAFEDHSKALGIGNIRFFMIRGEGEIRKVNEDEIVVRSTTSGNIIHIATEYIFGNAVRDASGKVDIQEFEQTMDFNNVSAEINQLIRREVLPGLKENVAIDKKISFVGAIELNKEQFDLNNIELIPVRVGFPGNESKDSE